MTAIFLKGVKKKFGSTKAVDGINLSIDDGELFFLLGPSGCGKTTLLRMIAGFVEPDAGKIFFGKLNVTNIPPNKRNTGMVFQNYALWPHLSVFDNVAYGLEMKSFSKMERKEKTENALNLVHMQDYAKQKPEELSGGQQQRIALARALVIEPAVLLLDEPLSNLDAKLRMDMREQIRRICSETGITTVYVTHDQKEALSLADNIAVMDKGKIVQMGEPRRLYTRPHSRFVADFLGETNFINAIVSSAENGSVVLDTPAGNLVSTAFDDTTPRGGNVTCSIRPESIKLIEAADSKAIKRQKNTFSGKRIQTVFMGEIAQHLIELADGTVLKVFEMNPPPEARQQSKFQLSVDPDEVVILPD